MGSNIDLKIQTDPVWYNLYNSVEWEWDNFLLLGEGGSVSVPSILLLSASSLVRKTVHDLLPAFHSPIAISVPTASLECLVCLKTILMNKGKSVVRDGNILEKVKNLFTMFGIKAGLSCEKPYSPVHHGAPDDHHLRSNNSGSCDMTDDESTFMVNIKAEILDEIIAAENMGDISIKTEQIEENTGLKTDITFDELGEVEQTTQKENSGLTTEMAFDEDVKVDTEQPSPNLVTRVTTPIVVVQANSHVIEEIVDIGISATSKPEYISSSAGQDCILKYNYRRVRETAPWFHLVKKNKSIEALGDEPDVKPYVCPQCDYASGKKSHMTIHLRIHTGEKPFKCKLCNFMTTQSSHLYRHMKTH